MSNALARLQRTVDRRCDANDFPLAVCKRKARRLYYIVTKLNPGKQALRTRREKLNRHNRVAATLFEPITKD